MRNQQYNLMIHESFDRFIKLFLSFTNHPISSPSYDLRLLLRLCKLFFGFENCDLSLAGRYLETWRPYVIKKCLPKYGQGELFRKVNFF